MSKVINLTPHEVTLLDGGNCEFSPKTRSYKVDGDVKVLRRFAPEGVCPRCSQSEEIVENIDGTNVYRLAFGEVSNLPDEQEDTYYIVSIMVAQARPDRHDLIAPAHLVRDADGQILGCLAFSRM